MAFDYKSLFKGNAPKFRPFVALTFTTLMSSLLIWHRKVRSTGTFHDAVTSNPATAAFVKQIIAGLFGATWLYAAGSFFNLTTRLRLSSPRRTPSLQALNVWTAVGSQRGTQLVLSGVVQSLQSRCPPTFQKTTTSWCHSSVLLGSLNNFRTTATTTTLMTARVRLTTGYPASYQRVLCQNLILVSASSASSAITYDGMPRIHSKNDNPLWSYFGRSYGVGSSQGITELSVSSGDLLWYSYTETGYLVDTHCSYNTTSAFSLVEVLSYQPTNGSNVTLSVFVAKGTLPNDEADFIQYPLVLTNRTNVANDDVLTWIANSKNGANMISIVGYGAYKPYNKMQCSVDFTQTRFDVMVNVTSSSINVTIPGLDDTPPDPSFDENHHLKSNAMASLSLIAQTASSIAFEGLGESLSNNWQTFNQSIDTANITFDPNQTFYGNGDSITSAAEDSFNAMLDDILVGYGAAQLFWGRGIQASNTTDISTYNSTRLGQDGYIFATLAINILLILVGLEEAVRTRNWKQMSRLDYLDLKSIIVATSAGGKEIWEECNSRHPEGTAWDGNNSSKEAASVRVRLGQRSNGSPGAQPVIVLAQTANQEGAADGVSEDGIPLTGWHSDR